MYKSGKIILRSKAKRGIKMKRSKKHTCIESMEYLIEEAHDLEQDRMLEQEHESWLELMEELRQEKLKGR